MPTTPLVSVLIPAWNRERYIEQAVRSALAQTMEDLEVVVSDNASTDRTREIVEKLVAEDPRVRLLSNSENIGPVRNWRCCAGAARGKYAKILWSDDMDHPEFLGSATAAMEADESLGFFMSNAALIDPTGWLKREALHVFPGRAGPMPSRDYLRTALLSNRLPVSPGCLLLRTKDLRKSLESSIGPRPAGDPDMHGVGADVLVFLETAASYPRVFVEHRSLACFREHSDSITTASKHQKIALLYLVAKGSFLGCHLREIPPSCARDFVGLLRLSAWRLRAAEVFGTASWRDLVPPALQEVAGGIGMLSGALRYASNVMFHMRDSIRS